MEALKATEQKQDSPRQKTSLENRYGRIGISAVAAAVNHRPEQRPATERRYIPADSD